MRELEITTEDDPVGIRVPVTVLRDASFFELAFAVATASSRRTVPKALQKRLLSGEGERVEASQRGADWFSLEVPPVGLHILCGWFEQLAGRLLNRGDDEDALDVYDVLRFLRDAERNRSVVFIADRD